MTEIRCKKCERLLFKSEKLVIVEIKCPKCGHVQVTGSNQSTYRERNILKKALAEKVFTKELAERTDKKIYDSLIF